MRVVTFNIHAGVDGWGRAFDATTVTRELGANLLFVQELWRGEEEDQVEALTAGNLQLVAHAALSNCERVTAAPGGRGWQSPLALLRGDEGLYFSEREPLSARRRQELDHAAGVQFGTWGVGLFSDYAVISQEVITLPQLRRDKSQRILIVARLRDGDHDFYALAIHGAHLSHGSLRQYRFVQGLIDDLEPLPKILAGDFNCWRPLLRCVLPRWRSGIRGRTWPAWFTHSQIDHVLLRGPWRITARRHFDGGSDHLGLVVDLDWN